MTIVFIREGRTAALLAAAAWFVILAAPLHAQELRVHVSEDSVTVGQRFYVSIATEHDFAADPAFPDTGDSLAFGDLEVMRRHMRDSFTRDGMRIDSVVYEVTTFALDTAAIAPIRVRFTAGEDTFSVRTPEMLVPVISLVPPDAQDVRDLAPLVEFPVVVWPYIVGGALLLLLAALFAMYLWKRRGPEDRPAGAPVTPPDPPHIEALKRLRALENSDLNRRDAVQPYYTELSDTLRHYLARRLHVQAMETTTRELIRDLAHRDFPKPDTTRDIQIVLFLADYVKYADAEPPREQGRDALLKTRDIVQSVEDALRPPEPSPDNPDLAPDNGRTVLD